MEFPIAPSRVISYAVGRYLTPVAVALLLEVSFAPAGWPAAALGLSWQAWPARRWHGRSQWALRCSFLLDLHLHHCHLAAAAAPPAEEAVAALPIFVPYLPTNRATSLSHTKSFFPSPPFLARAFFPDLPPPAAGLAPIWTLPTHTITNTRPHLSGLHLCLSFQTYLAFRLHTSLQQKHLAFLSPPPTYLQSFSYISRTSQYPKASTTCFLPKLLSSIPPKLRFLETQTR